MKLKLIKRSIPLQKEKNIEIRIGLRFSSKDGSRIYKIRQLVQLNMNGNHTYCCDHSQTWSKRYLENELSTGNLIFIGYKEDL